MPFSKTDSSDRPMPSDTAPAPLSVGMQLILAREARNETIGAISLYLKIKPEYLFAFEQGKYEQLPALTYTLGFLRAYADYLGLDGEKLREEFRAEILGRLTPHLSLPQARIETKTPSLAVILVALCAAFSLLLYWNTAYDDLRSRMAVSMPPQPATDLVLPPIKLSPLNAHE